MQAENDHLREQVAQHAKVVQRLEVVNEAAVAHATCHREVSGLFKPEKEVTGDEWWLFIRFVALFCFFVFMSFHSFFRLRLPPVILVYRTGPVVLFGV